LTYLIVLTIQAVYEKEPDAVLATPELVSGTVRRR
jgi:hypothetical protein